MKQDVKLIVQAMVDLDLAGDDESLMVVWLGPKAAPGPEEPVKPAPKARRPHLRLV